MSGVLSWCTATSNVVTEMWSEQQDISSVIVSVCRLDLDVHKFNVLRGEDATHVQSVNDILTTIVLLLCTLHASPFSL